VLRTRTEDWIDTVWCLIKTTCSPKKSLIKTIRSPKGLAFRQSKRDECKLFLLGNKFCTQLWEHVHMYSQRDKNIKIYQSYRGVNHLCQPICLPNLPPCHLQPCHVLPQCHGRSARLDHCRISTIGARRYKGSSYFAAGGCCHGLAGATVVRWRRCSYGPFCG
jgi:hypothetical protein